MGRRFIVDIEESKGGGCGQLIGWTMFVICLIAIASMLGK
jgi:hypothetical protein